jgi:hypothetical protein
MLEWMIADGAASGALAGFGLIFILLKLLLGFRRAVESDASLPSARVIRYGRATR